MSVSLSAIETMLVCYWSPDPRAEIGDWRWQSVATQAALQWLTGEGLLTPDYSATERGELWVEEIRRSPLPVQRWVTPGRNKP